MFLEQREQFSDDIQITYFNAVIILIDLSADDIIFDGKLD